MFAIVGVGAFINVISNRQFDLGLISQGCMQVDGVAAVQTELRTSIALGL